MNTKSMDILVESCKANNRKAQKELYNLYKNAMFTICLRIVVNEDDAKDALQEGFISVFTGLKSFKGKSTIGAWIKTIMIRAALKKVKKDFTKDIEAIDNLFVEDVDIFSGQDLHNAILQLDDGYRSVFVLYEVEGYSHKEIAEMLGINVGTSKSQLHYAKKKLQSIIVKQYEYERR